jgi:DNA polymerase-3 subunit epsilon
VSLLRRWFPSRPQVPPHLREALQRWQPLPAPDLGAPLSQTRFVAVDTETSGLDPGSARMLSIGACAIEHASLRLDQTFERTLRQESPTDDANILVHGLGRERQASGDPAADALAAFLAYAGRPVFVGYHALFDATVVARTLRAALGLAPAGDWLDLAVLLPALFADRGRAGSELDHWLEAFGLAGFARHSALGDAYATAQLMLLVLARAPARGIRDPRGLFALQRTQLGRAVTAHGGMPAG